MQMANVQKYLKLCSSNINEEKIAGLLLVQKYLEQNSKNKDETLLLLEKTYFSIDQKFFNAILKNKKIEYKNLAIDLMASFYLNPKLRNDINQNIDILINEYFAIKSNFNRFDNLLDLILLIFNDESSDFTGKKFDQFFNKICSDISAFAQRLIF
ncbi:hypothetical protein MHBO_000914 [Bonamia ostreae]|uniref:Uncharacterized protein n=1 Tax=Bonamia ostreae TaxID=126728 RepID=A0ABV2AH58_9EUKA